MTDCTNCSAKAQLFLCRPCTSELRDMLLGLARGQKLANGEYAAGWLEHLQEAALGFTRLGDIIRHRRGDEQPMRLNLKASELLQYAHSILVEWIRDICETRGVPIPALVTSGDLALWLAKNVNAIASEESAGLCYREIKETIVDIERIINRPIPPRYCGNCPTLTEDQQRCAVALYAKRDAEEVRCWKCKTVHNVEAVINSALDGTDGWLLTAREVREVMEKIGEPISDRTWRHWRTTGKIQSRNEWGAEPKYFIEEVRHLRMVYGQVGVS